MYNVPLADALFTAEILIGSITLPVILSAVVCAWIATGTRLRGYYGRGHQ